MVILLIAVAVMMRLTYKEPHHPDHYIWGSYTYTVIDKGYAPWVLHPLSLFGYFPLSVPSGFEFLTAYISMMTGLDLPQLYIVFSIISGLIAGLGVYVLMRSWTNFHISFLSSYILITMAFFMKVTSNTASTRVTNIMLYPVFILLLFKLYESNSKIRSFKYILTLFVMFIIMSIIHRLSQMSLIFVIAFLCALAAKNWKKLLKIYTKSQFYKIREKHYFHSHLYFIVDVVFISSLYASMIFIGELPAKVGYIAFALYFYFIMGFRKFKNKDEIFFDIVLYAVLLIVAKMVDLGLRSRLLIHVAKVFPGITLQTFGLLIGGGIVILGGLYLAFHNYFRQLLYALAHITERLVERTFRYANKHPEQAISTVLFVTFIMAVFATFTGHGLVGVDRSYYFSSFLLKGESSLIVLFNWLLNINNNLTILIWFALFGIIYLFFSKQRSFYHYFFIFVAIGFSQFVFDWEYARLYMNPIYAIFSALGVYVTFQTIRKKIRFKKTVLFLFAVVLILHLVFAGIFMQRDFFLSKLGLEENWKNVHEAELISAGEFMRTDDDSSILSSTDAFRTPLVGFYARKMDAVSAQSVHIDEDNLEIRKINVSTILDNFLHGRKVTDFYHLTDWILPGTYYHGRHIRFFLTSEKGDKLYDRVINDYRIRYIVDNRLELDKEPFFSSIEELKDKVYSSDSLDIYDIKKGSG